MKRAIFAAALALAAPAAAEVFTLSDVGNWRLSLAAEEGSRPECILATANPREKLVFAIHVDSEGVWMLRFTKPNVWTLPEKSGPIRLDVDYAQFDAIGISSGADIYVVSREFERLFTALRNGSAVALYSPSGRRLATASLAGSIEALAALDGCFEGIETAPANADPFI